MTNEDKKKNDAGTNKEVTNETPATETPTSKWEKFIKPLVDASDKTSVEIAENLGDLVGEPNDEAIALLQSEETTPFEDIRKCLPDIPLAKLRKAVSDLRKVEVVEAVAMTGAISDQLLPNPMDDESFLALLKTGGELKVDKLAIISAMRAALANRAKLYELPKLLIQRMEQYAEELEDPVGPAFFKLRKLLTRRNYAEIFAAMEGIDGNFVTESRKDKLLAKLDENLWGALFGFHEQLKGWMESWQQTAGNPAAMMTAMAAMVSGGTGQMPQMLNQPPETDTLRDAADSMKDRINGVFSGVGVPVARALAFDAQNIKAVLEEETLPAQIGAPNREQMLKMLGADVSADYVRLERNITRYMLGVIEFSKVAAGQEEIQYLSALIMLGNAIPWDKLSE